MSFLPFNLEDLIHARSVESSQIEYKRSWSEPTLAQVIKSVTAFANDFHNLGGGYIILGIEDQDGRPVLPPNGLDGQNMDLIQKQIRGNCRRIDPEYQPAIFVEIFMGKQIMIIWAPGGDVRPYQSPVSSKTGEREYYIRLGSESVIAQGTNLTQLMQMTARIPFDDRRNLSHGVNELSPTLVRKYLVNVKSKLMDEISVLSDEELYESLRIVDSIHGKKYPKNVALLFFSNSPDSFFPGAKIEIVQFRDDVGGDLIDENSFVGPLDMQIKMSLDFLNNLSTSMTRKIPGKAEALRTVAFPYEALEEALVNSVFHKSYEINEPVKVYLYPDRMEIISYPGPMPGLKIEDLLEGKRLPPVQNRNRRIGEFLKDFRLAEARGTGIPKIRRRMIENGSPAPIFEFDEEKSYFRVTLPAHPQYIVINSLRESAHLWATGERAAAIKYLEDAAKKATQSGALIAQLIDYKAAFGGAFDAEKLFSAVRDDEEIVDKHLPFLSMIKYYLDNNQAKKATELLEKIPAPREIHDILDLALLNKRARRFKEAHRTFLSHYDLIKDEPKAIHEFAQTKMKLASSSKERFTKQRLNREAIELLRRCIQLSDDDTRRAWCWFDLARNLIWVHSPEDEIENAFMKAIELLPAETRFIERYAAWKEGKRTF